MLGGVRFLGNCCRPQFWGLVGDRDSGNLMTCYTLGSQVCVLCEKAGPVVRPFVFLGLAPDFPPNRRFA